MKLSILTLIAFTLMATSYLGLERSTVRATLTLNGGEAVVVVGGVTLRARVDDAGDIVVPEQDGLTENRDRLVRALIREAIQK